MKLENLFGNDDFIIKFIEKYKLVINKKCKKENLTNEENNFMKFSEYYFSYVNVLRNLKKVIDFLSIDVDKISLFFPFLKNEQEYYKYHYENYILRILTVPDLIGKMGNAIFDLKIKEKDCNCYRFKKDYFKIVRQNDDIIQIIEQVLKFTEEFKEDRHSIIHRGKTNFEKLSYLDLQILSLKVFNTEDDIDFRNSSYTNIKCEIEIFENEILDLYNLCNKFLSLICKNF